VTKDCPEKLETKATQAHRENLDLQGNKEMLDPLDDQEKLEMTDYLYVLFTIRAFKYRYYC